MKILAIGNSFSEDATAYLKKIADSAREELTIVNLYIGGCSFETHAKNIAENNPLYRYELNGVHTNRYASIADVLKEDNWDAVTVQQASYDAGVPESFGENAKSLISCIKKNAPQAKIYFHETWAYESDSSHGGFAAYNFSQKEMYERIGKTTADFCAANGNIPIIHCGEVIKRVRELPDFDYSAGGQTLCRDGFHMHLIYGRYLTAATWFETLTGKDIHSADFAPSVDDIINGYEKPVGFVTDFKKIEEIKDVIHSVCSE